MSLRLVLGASGAGKTHFLCEKMLGDIRKNNKLNYIYIVPEQFTLETQKKIVKMQNELFSLSGIMNMDIVSFNRLSFRVFEELGVNRLEILDDTGKTLILRKIIEENKKSLKIYRDKSEMLGFISEMKSAISELYQYGIDADALMEIVNNINGHNMTKAKLSDIMSVYGCFREYVGSMTKGGVKYITKEEVLEELCSVIKDSAWIRQSSIVLDGYTGFTPIQLKVIGLLLEYGIDVTVALTIRTDDLVITNTGIEDIKEQELFNMSKETINQLYAIANDRRIPICEPVIIDGIKGRNCSNKEFQFIEKNIFCFNGKTFGDEIKGVEIYKASNPVMEARYITDLVLRLMKENKELRYRDIAIITGDEKQMMTLDRFMGISGIPHFVDSKKSIIRNPFVDSIRAVLEIIDTNFRYESVFKYLRCYMTDISPGDIDILENYCLALGINGKNRYLKPFTRMYKGMKEEELKKVEEIRVRFIEPIERLIIKVKNKNVREVTTAVYEFIAECEFKNKLKKYIEFFEASGDNSLKSEYSQVYKKVMELFDKIVMLLGDEILKLSEYRKILDAGFEEIKVGIIPLSVDELIIGDIERTRLGEVKVLFIMGANDGIIPKHGNKGSLLSQSDRIVLKDLSVNLSPTVRESYFIQRFYLYLSVTKPTDKLVITYSDCSSDGSVIRPSYLIESLTDLFDDKKFLKTIKNKNVKDMVSKATVLDYLLENIKAYGSEEFNTELLEILSYGLTDNDLKEKLQRGIEGAFFTNRVNSIDESVAKIIYGNDTVARATRLEKYAACAYSHFLEYGLKLAERPVYEIKAADVGNIYHSLIELYTRKIKENNISLEAIDDKKRQELIHICMDEIARQYQNDVFFATKRNKFIFEKCERVADKTAWALTEQLKRGNFSMENLELSVENGRIDRVDTLELDGTKYIKIIDYKSGATKFSPVEAANGLKMQLMFYMDSVLERERAKNSGVRVEPGAVFYFNIQEPLIDYSEAILDEEVYKKKLLSEFTMSGFVNSRQEVFENLDEDIKETAVNSVVFGMGQKNINCSISLSKTKGAGSSYNFERFIDFVKETADKFANEIIEGNISLKPYKMGKKTPCEYCVYKDVCSFDCRSFKNSYNIMLDDTKENTEKIKKMINGEVELNNDETKESREV